VLHVSWELDEEHVQFRGTCRAFTDREVRPLVEHAEAEGQFPGELWKPLGAAGLMGLVTPEVESLRAEIERVRKERKPS